MNIKTDFMDNKNNIYEIALERTKKIKERIKGKGESFRYKDSIYVSINKVNELTISETPDILKNEDAYQCIMIHSHERKEYSNWYSWYTVQFIGNDGRVLTEKLDERFNLRVDYAEHFRYQWMYLIHDNKCIFSLTWPNLDKLQDVWNLYIKCKSCDTHREAELLGELAKRDMSIFSLTSKVANLDYTTELLKQERDMYKSLLDDIRNLIKDKK